MGWKPVQDAEEKRALAIDIALAAGALARCRRHACLFLGPQPLDAALAVAESRYRPGDLKGPFGSREELAASVREVVNEQYRDDCPFCSKWLDE